MEKNKEVSLASIQQTLLKPVQSTAIKVEAGQKADIQQFYDNYQKYKIQTRKFHILVLYIFGGIQILWIILSFNITSVNNYNTFIDQFQSNFNQQYKAAYLKLHPGYSKILANVNSFDSDYTIICCLIWISHLGFQFIFGYIVYSNRLLFKQFQSGVREMLPIFFTLLTVYVIRDCLLMSVSQVVLKDLTQIQVFIQSQRQQFLTYDANFLTFIYTSLVLVQELTGNFGILQILTYVQQICDLTTISVLTVHIFRIYLYSRKCISSKQNMILKKQFSIEPLAVAPPPSHHHMSQFGKYSEERQYSTAHNQTFLSRSRMIPFHKQQAYSHKEPIGRFHDDVSQIPSAKDHFMSKQHKMLKKSKSNKNVRKLSRSGSCNYLKGSIQISELNDIADIKQNHLADNNNLATKLRIKKSPSVNCNLIESSKAKKKVTYEHQQNFVKGQNVSFEV